MRAIIARVVRNRWKPSRVAPLQRVRRENRPIKMEPMPSNERRIVHDFLKSEVWSFDSERRPRTASLRHCCARPRVIISGVI